MKSILDLSDSVILCRNKKLLDLPDSFCVTAKSCRNLQPWSRFSRPKTAMKIVMFIYSFIADTQMISEGAPGEALLSYLLQENPKRWCRTPRILWFPYCKKCPLPLTYNHNSLVLQPLRNEILVHH